MDGAPDITVAHRGYVLHFCSADCKQTFERDPGAVIRELPAPRS
jgi:YHS domain-containing protein